MKRLSRRALLRGVIGGAAVSVALPWLEAMSGKGARAQQGGSGFPKRFGIFCWGNGVIPVRWNPPTEGASFELSEQLQPLAAHKRKLCVVSGTRVLVPNIEPHFATAAGALSGRPITKVGNDWTVSGPTIDQGLARAVGGETRFASIETGVVGGDGLSYNGPNSVNPPETSPRALFDRLFGAGFRLPGASGQVDPVVPVQRSVLDAVMGDLARIQAQVSVSDRQRLEQHLEGVRALERRLARLEEDPPNLAACQLPNTPLDDYPDVEGRPQIAERNKAMAELLAMALACDQTRVFSHFLTRPVNNVLFPGAPAGHHQLTHDEIGDLQPNVHAIVLQCVTAFGELLTALDAIPEGDGTVLDHSLIYGTTDVSWGKVHSPDDFPIVLAGGADGALKRDFHYRSSSGETTSKVLLSVCRAMGLDLPSFGADEGETRDSLGAIEA